MSRLLVLTAPLRCLSCQLCEKSQKILTDLSSALFTSHAGTSWSSSIRWVVLLVLFFKNVFKFPKNRWCCCHKEKWFTLVPLWMLFPILYKWQVKKSHNSRTQLIFSVSPFLFLSILGFSSVLANVFFAVDHIRVQSNNNKEFENCVSQVIKKQQKRAAWWFRLVFVSFLRKEAFPC